MTTNNPSELIEITQIFTARDKITKVAYNLADILRKVYWTAADKRIFGASVALQDVETDEFLVVRQTYGDTDRWGFPGGGLPRAEQKVERKEHVGVLGDLQRYRSTALRELSEEVAYPTQRIISLDHLVTVVNYSGHGRDQHTVFLGKTTGLHEQFGNLVPSSEISAIGLLTPDRLREVPTHYSVKPALDNLK